MLNPFHLAYILIGKIYMNDDEQVERENKKGVRNTV